jgi:hypothetical protein
VVLNRFTGGLSGTENEEGGDDDADQLALIRKVANDCDVDLDKDVQEVMVSVLPNQVFAIAARLDRPGASIVDCLVKQGHERQKGEYPAVVLDDVRVMAVGDVVIAGNSEELEMVADATAPPWLKRVGVLEHALASTNIMVNEEGLWMLSMSLLHENDTTKAVTMFRGIEAEDADLMVNTFRTMAPSIAEATAANWEGKAQRRLHKWLDSATIRRTVTHGAEITLEMPKESGARLEQRMEAMKLFVKGLGTTVDRKRSENGAKAVLWNLALRLTNYAEEHKTGWGTKLPSFPGSTPLTPADVPRGDAGQTSEDDWSHATWKSLDFSMFGARRYSYQIQLSADRRRATILAVADQDGDGDRQELSLGVTVKGDGKIVTDPYIDVKNPLD